jgi:hypothetical protein
MPNCINNTVISIIRLSSTFQSHCLLHFLIFAYLAVFTSSLPSPFLPQTFLSIFFYIFFIFTASLFFLFFLLILLTISFSSSPSLNVSSCRRLPLTPHWGLILYRKPIKLGEQSWRYSHLTPLTAGRKLLLPPSTLRGRDQTQLIYCTVVKPDPSSRIRLI